MTSQSHANGMASVAIALKSATQAEIIEVQSFLPALAEIPTATEALIFTTAQVEMRKSIQASCRVLDQEDMSTAV